MNITETLRPHVPAISEDLRSHDDQLRKHAAAIVNLHRMHVDCPGDPTAPALCESAFLGWMKRRAELKLDTPDNFQ